MAKKNELAVLDTFKLAKPFEGMDPELLAELEDELADLDEGSGIECRRIKMPSGGALAFEVEGEDGDVDYVKEIQGVILFTHRVNGYWSRALGDGEGNAAPDCSSMDGKAGINNATGECINCESCPLNQYGSDPKGGEGKACKNMRRVYLMTSGDPNCYLLTVPPTSIKDVNKKLKNGIISNIPTILQAGVQLIVTLAQGLLQAIPSLIAAIPQICWSIITALTSVNWLQVGWDIFMTLVDGVKSIDWLQLGMDILNAIKDGILSAVGGLFESVGNIWNNVTSFFSGKGKETGDSTAAAIQSTTPAVQEAASGVGRSAVTGMQNSLNTSIPSLTANANAAGAALTNGINSGVASGAGQLDSTVASMGASATASLNGSINQGLASVNTSAVASGTAYTDGMTAGLQSGMPGVQSAAQTGCDAVVQQTTSSFERVRSAVETKMNAAATAVTNAVGKMRAAMNFSWSLPHLKVPHVNISGAFSLQPPTAPNFSVSWYKEGGILSGAQIFGAQGGRLLGGGEAGKEAVLPLSTLWQQMRGMFAESVGGVRERINTLGQQLGLAENSRRLSFADLLGGIGGPQPATAGGPPMQINYSPQYYFQGEAPTKEDLEGAEEMSQSKFNEMMAKWIKDHSRKDF